MMAGAGLHTPFPSSCRVFRASGRGSGGESVSAGGTPKAGEEEIVVGRCGILHDAR